MSFIHSNLFLKEFLNQLPLFLQFKNLNNLKLTILGNVYFIQRRYVFTYF
jgi:hypothetical protein